MSKKLKNNPENKTPPKGTTPDGAGSTTVKADAGRRAGKDIVPRLRVIDGASYVLMASSKSKAISTNLLWAPSPKDPVRPFLFMFDLPDGAGGSVLIHIPMGQAQAQAVYAAHPRRVPRSEMPPECPLEAVDDGPEGPEGPEGNANPEGSAPENTGGNPEG